MRKTFKALAALLLSAVGSTVMAQFSNVEGTISWAVGNESKATVTTEIADAIVESTFTVGTDLSVSGPTTYTQIDNAGPYVTYCPTTSNAGCVAGDMIEYKVMVKKGLTFTPTSVSFDAVKEGTDNAFFSWSYTVDGKESDIVKYSDPKNQIRRNNNANPSAPLTHNETISAEGGRTFTLRFYISDVANNKKMSIGNIKVNGKVNGDIEKRSFTDFKIDFRTDPYTVLAPESGLPAGVTVNGTFHDAQHGYNQTTLTFAVDGPVKLTFGTCGYGSDATVADASGNKLATIDSKTNGCDTNTSFDHFTTWVYNSEEPTTLTVTSGSYIPFFYAEACELLPMVNVEYFDTDGTTLLGKETVQGGSPLKYKFGAEDVKVATGSKFRGWFAGTQSTSLKVAEGTTVADNLKLYAKATPIEVVSSTARFIYDLTKASFYQEDHEAIEIDGKYYNSHGWLIDSGKTLKVNVSEKAYITIGNCFYSNESEAVVTDPDGQQVATFQVKAATDGAEYTLQYDGKAGWVTITFPKGAYVHSVAVSNVVDFLTYDEATKFYQIASGDVSSLLLALKAASSQPGTKIFLPNGVYDLGETVLTSISGTNISIIGESMEGTIIRNAPAKEVEGIGTTATFLNTSTGLYMQDLTLQNALDYYGAGAAGRAVCLQDKGKNTICKNVRMLSYQDTYYSNAASNFYWEDSEIHGTVDYLCGDGDVVYNRCLFVNESRERTAGKGDCTVCAPYTSASCTWGYVFLDCKIDTKSASFNLGRSWGGESKAQYVRCQDLTDKLVKGRWTLGGMNVAAYKFKEYGMLNKAGVVTTPASNVLTFTHASGNKTYETVLSAEEAAKYTVSNIYGTWNPDVTCAQETMTDAEVASPVSTAIYLVDGNITLGTIPAGATAVRKANTRGGFGPELKITPTSIESLEVEAPEAEAVVYDLAGQRVSAEATGLLIVGGKKVYRY